MRSVLAVFVASALVVGATSLARARPFRGRAHDVEVEHSFDADTPTVIRIVHRRTRRTGRYDAPPGRWPSVRFVVGDGAAGRERMEHVRGDMERSTRVLPALHEGHALVRPRGASVKGHRMWLASSGDVG
jgi:hypothetical protein